MAVAATATATVGGARAGMLVGEETGIVVTPRNFCDAAAAAMTTFSSAAAAAGTPKPASSTASMSPPSLTDTLGTLTYGFSHVLHSANMASLFAKSTGSSSRSGMIRESRGSTMSLTLDRSTSFSFPNHCRTPCTLGVQSITSSSVISSAAILASARRSGSGGSLMGLGFTGSASLLSAKAAASLSSMLSRGGAGGAAAAAAAATSEAMEAADWVVELQASQEKGSGAGSLDSGAAAMHRTLRTLRSLVVTLVTLDTKPKTPTPIATTFLSLLVLMLLEELRRRAPPPLPRRPARDAEKATEEAAAADIAPLSLL
mmetsp:Transcript_18135/g.45042  ORF Transcript_18135/g.45042 Transcript_18135/m.45042 type:complete len:315 (+) Transcript_18135:46-990(+)